MNPVELWRAVEKIEDMLAQTPDLQDAFGMALQILLDTLERTGSALYIPRFCEHIPVDWTFVNVPQEWQDASVDTNALLFKIARHVLETGESAPADPNLDLAGALPVKLGQRCFGALLIRGAPLAADEISSWTTLLRPFARLVSIHAAASGNTNGVPGYLELMRSRNTLRSMFDSLPISIYIIDEDYKLKAVNNSRANRVGSTPKQLVGLKCYQAFYDRTQPCPGCRVMETFGKGAVTSRIERNRLGPDSFEEWDISTFPIFDEQNKVFQATVIGEDVTEKRNLEAHLLQSEKLAAVGELAAGVAHEINNPLTAIIANAQLLRQEIDATNSDLADSVKLIEVAGTRASQVVRNLLGIARKESYELEPVDLNTTIHNALSLVQHELVGRPITVQLELSEDMPLVSASQEQLESVWINLFINAIDAIDKDPGRIIITSYYTDGQFQVTVTDNGKGIPADQLPKVFEPFFTTKTHGRGTGLGLSVSMRAVRLHGGTLQVESQHGEWTRFIVTLPGPV